MNEGTPQTPGQRPDPWFVVTGAAPALLVLATWFASAAATGEPLQATRRLIMAGVLALVLHDAAGRRLADSAVARQASRATVALSPVLMLWAIQAARAFNLDGLPCEAFVALAWGGVLFPAVGLLRTRAMAGRLPSSLRTIAGTVAALLGAALLSHGVHPVALSLAAVLLTLRSPIARSGAPTASSPPMSILAGALAGAWLLAIPPILMAYCGALPHGVAIVVTSLLMGLATGRAMLGPMPGLPWIAAVGVGASGLLTLVVAAEYPTIVALSAASGLGGLSSLLPWCVLAVVAAGSGGIAAATAEPQIWRTAWFGAGLLLGAAFIAIASATGIADLPLRTTVGLGCLAAMLLIGVPGLGHGEVRGRTVGWVACSCLAIAVGVVPQLPLQSAILGLFARIPAGEPTTVRELDEAVIVQTGVDRCGPHGIIRTARGEYVFRAWEAREPGPAAIASETLLGLLPVLAAGEPRTATVIGVDRGAVLAPLRRANVTDLVLLDLAPSWASQIRHADGDASAMLANPSVRIERRFPLPSLPVPRHSQDVVVVSLPPPSMPGSAAWYGSGMMAELSASLTDDGWAAIGIPTRSLQAADLAGVVAAFSTVFPDGTVWVDAGGHGDVILLGSPAGGLPDAGTMVRGLERYSLRATLGDGDVRSAEDLFARAFTRADAPLFSERARTRTGLSWRSARVILDGETGIPLAQLADAAQPLESLIDFQTLSPAELEGVLGEQSASRTIWPLYLQFVDLLARGETHAALQLADDLREQSTDPARDLVPLARQLVEASRVAAALGRHEDAQSWLLASDALAADDIETDLSLGRQAWANGNLRDAAMRFERVLEQDPDHLVALLGAAHSHIRLGELQLALPQLERAVGAHPDSVDALHNLGRLYVDLGRLDDAMEQYRHATPIAPDNARIQFGIGEVHFLWAVRQAQAGEDADANLADARRALQRAMILETDPLILSLAGQIELLARNYGVAESLLKESLRLDPAQFEARAALGEAFFAQREFHAAARQFTEAARLHSADERVQFRLEQLRHLAPDAFEETEEERNGG